MKRLLPVLLAVCSGVVPVARAAEPILPFSEVRAGMKGTGHTVFQGTRVETFEVEILGTLPRIAPDQNLILARCSGGPLAETGILAGMSGSPVYIDGKLVGAVAYAWGFAKDALAGITPIEEMLAVAAREDARTARPRAFAGGSAAAQLDRLRSHDGLLSFFSGTLPSLLPRSAAGRAAVPLSVAGVGAEGVARIAEDLRETAFLPVQGIPAGASPSTPSPPLRPGSAVGVKLTRGDVDMTATGTVTWVDGDRVLAFGHPLFGLGAVDLPMTGARVEMLLPSLHRSSRFAIPLAEVGSLRQDRASAVFGRAGATPRMIPVRLSLTTRGGVRKSYAFDVADDPLLAPLLVYASLNGILEGNERMLGSMTLRLRSGSVIKLEGQEDVALDNLFAGPTAPFYATGTPAFILYLVLNNDWSPARVTGVNLLLEHDDEPRTGRVRRVTLDRYRVRAGDTLQATIVLSPFRGPDVVLTRPVEIPAETPPGRLTLQVGGAAAVSRAEGRDEPIQPRDLGQLVWLINRLRRNDRVYLIASRDDTGVFLDGARMPNLPPSVASVLARPASRGNFAMIPQRGILEEEIPVEFEVEGFARLQVEVEAPR